MQTRRQILEQALCIPLALHGVKGRAPSSVEIISESDCLSQESARGFALVPAPAGHMIVVCGAGTKAMQRAPELRERAMAGAWIVWESAPGSMQSLFGIKLGRPFKPGLYIEYLWPRRALTRSFLAVIPVECAPSEIIAQHDGIPVAMKRRIGRGGIVFLGSMLGPNLYAEDPEAHRIADQIFKNSLRRYIQSNISQYVKSTAPPRSNG